MKIDIIAGARPNFIKIAPIIDALKEKQILIPHLKFRLVHTGQHYDEKMSGSFFKQLGIPHPDINLNVGSGSQAKQTAKIMIAYENLLEKSSADICLVVGDVNSTMACSIVAKKMGLLVVHVEGGIRSNDISMPEEINRMITDSISDYFYTTSEYANSNLKKLGVNDDKIIFVGNTMIDSLVKNISKINKPKIFDNLNLINKEYFILTLHRPANVDNNEVLKNILIEIDKNVSNKKIIFPIHPRTKKILSLNKINISNFIILEPLSYFEFIYLLKNTLCIITDSGGITEEATFLGIPCLTLRNNTERPETIDVGTNKLIGTNIKNIPIEIKNIIKGNWKKGGIPELWDGQTSKRIVEHLLKIK